VLFIVDAVGRRKLLCPFLAGDAVIFFHFARAARLEPIGLSL